MTAYFKKNTWLWWSSGKDSAWALHELRQAEEYKVSGLIVTVNQDANRVAMHAVRRSLVEVQAKRLGLPVFYVEIPYPCSNDDYVQASNVMIQRAQEADVSHMAFGDLFLEDVRAYREKLLEGSGIECVFPLWGRDTSSLAIEMIESGIEAYLSCVDPKVLAPEFVGRCFDHSLLSDLPTSVDRCGENGEFHTFVSSSPDFEKPIDVQVGQKIERDDFWFADICLTESQAK